jgi:hypothetical protein
MERTVITADFKCVDRIVFLFFFLAAIRELPNPMVNYHLISKDVKEWVLWLIDHQ